MQQSHEAKSPNKVSAKVKAQKVKKLERLIKKMGTELGITKAEILQMILGD